ncbi:predicted protein [Sclerotinia sclerotiorum 1980 UF-70]|uniref:Uncharacterized protein n=1 Tax=Sclerotinia sclerotiorum (strain ATCC 18683 / 1980 / Ss-1) TaxID=665079 RepID=A7EF79_SCLS1|nr:predicted protein [Sclerotinia sclerotiorum 1980 UF-70]EDO01495.1 predicted protein [Sclerotinia sclerotiorum 1980 UF-70]
MCSRTRFWAASFGTRKGARRLEAGMGGKGWWVELTIASRPRPPLFHFVAPVFGLRPLRGAGNDEDRSGWLVALARVALGQLHRFLGTIAFKGGDTSPGMMHRVEELPLFTENGKDSFEWNIVEGKSVQLIRGDFCARSSGRSR